MVGAYSLVFKFLLRIQIEYYALFLFVGLTVWTFFLGGAQVASRSLVSNASLVTKVRFPREIVPLAAMTGNAFTAGAMLVVALPLCMLLSADSLLPLLALPGLVVLLAMLHRRLRARGRRAQRLLPRRRAHPHRDRAAVDLREPGLLHLRHRARACSGDNAWVGGLLHWGTRSRRSSSRSRTRSSSACGRPGATSSTRSSPAALALWLGWRLFRRLEREMAVEL